jgi:hypothetical protein
MCNWHRIVTGSAQLAKSGWLSALISLAMTIAMGASRAYAGVSVQEPVVSGTDSFNWAYELRLSPGARITFGDFVTIYDFGQFVFSSAYAPDGWIPIVQNIGADPNELQLLDPDDYEVFNLVFVRTGPTIMNSDVSQEMSLGAFGAASSTQVATTDLFAYQHRANDTGLIQGQGFISVPQAIPEPSIAIAIVGAASTFLFTRNRPRR